MEFTLGDVGLETGFPQPLKDALDVDFVLGFGLTVDQNIV